MASLKEEDVKKRVSIDELSSCVGDQYDEDDLVEEYEYHLWADVSPDIVHLD